ncbi:hypothetical protein ACET3Z_015388 [Daucus carota]
MKNENSHFSQANHDPHVQDLQRELMHLNKNYLRSGNVLERVLALKIELAEALRAKKTSSLHIQRQRKMRICSIVVWKELLFLKSNVAAEAKDYVEKNRDDCGGEKKAIFHVQNNRMNDAGIYCQGAYLVEDPLKLGPGYRREAL